MRSILLPALLLATPAPAADRAVPIGSIDRLRVEGPFAVNVTTGASPAVRVSGDAAAIAEVEVRSESGLLTIRRAVGGQWQDQRGAAAPTPVTIAVTTPSLSAVSLLGAGKVAVSRMAGARVDLSIGGDGAIAVAEIDAGEVRTQVIGAGTLTLAGKAVTARLMTNGPGTIDADRLAANDLIVGLDGLGTTTARARYTARVASSGLGSVTVAGQPKCIVRAPAGAPVVCGGPPAR